MSCETGQAIPGDREIALDLPEEASPQLLWEPVADLSTGEVAIEPDEAPGDREAWAPIADLAEPDFALKPPQLAQSDAPWVPLTGQSPPLLAERAPAAPSLPEPKGVRALLTGTTPARLSSPRTPLPWRGPFLAEELGEQNLTYRVALESLRSELIVVSWRWAKKAEAPCELIIRLADDGADLELTATQPDEPIVSLRGFLADRELRFDVLLVSDRARRGLLLGRDVLAEGFLVDPATDATAPEDCAGG
jgi:hypothetical protein